MFHIRSKIQHMLMSIAIWRLIMLNRIETAKFAFVLGELLAERRYHARIAKSINMKQLDRNERMALQMIVNAPQPCDPQLLGLIAALFV